MARHAFSLRIDPELLAGARQADATRGCSLNEFIVDAVARAVASADPDAAAARRAEVRERIARYPGAPLPSSDALIRELREEGRTSGQDGTQLPRQ